MVCLTEKIALGSSLTVLAGSGAIAIIGAPTVVLSVAGATIAVGSLFGAIASMNSLKECYERQGRIADADKLGYKVAQLETQLTDLRTRFGLT